MRITPTLSKAVGWDDRNVLYPRLEDVDDASDFNLLVWYRFLPSPENDEQRTVLDKIIQRLK